MRKQSITVQSESIFKRAFGRNTVQGEIPGCTPENVQLGQDENNNSVLAYVNHSYAG